MEEFWKRRNSELLAKGTPSYPRLYTKLFNTTVEELKCLIG